MKMNKKLIVATAACAALLIGSISTSLAWLLDTTDEVKNTFSTSTLGVTLTETDPTLTTENKNVAGLNIQMVPGWTYHKDPKVTVNAKSEDCYVFLKVEKSAGLDTFLAYTISDEWTVLQSASTDTYTVYCREYTKNNASQTYDILVEGTYNSYSYADNQVLVKPEITKEQMDAQTSNLTFTFTAYASQYWKNKNTNTKFEALDAWNNVQDNPANPSATNP